MLKYLSLRFRCWRYGVCYKHRIAFTGFGGSRWCDTCYDERLRRNEQLEVEALTKLFADLHNQE